MIDVQKGFIRVWCRECGLTRRVCVTDHAGHCQECLTPLELATPENLDARIKLARREWKGNAGRRRIRGWSLYRTLLAEKQRLLCEHNKEQSR